MKNLEHTSIAEYAHGRTITFGAKLVVIPMLPSPSEPAVRVAIGIEMPDGSAVFVGGREIADLQEVLVAAERAARVAAN